LRTVHGSSLCGPIPAFGTSFPDRPSGVVSICGKALAFQPTVLVADSIRELRWLGRLLATGLFDGDHSFSTEPIGEGGLRFVHRERSGALLVPLLWKMLDRDTRRGFEDMNRALKLRAESAS
jgi:hypothetical protein